MGEENGQDQIRAQILAQAMRWLARREYSIQELKLRLAQKHFSANDIALTVEVLVSQDLVSDRRFTESLVRNRTERGYGPLKITHELRAKGVDDTLIEEYVDAENECWLERLRGVWQKRFGCPPANYREWAKQARGLQSRGFSADQVRKVIPDIEP